MLCYQCMKEYDGPQCPYCGFSPADYVPIPTALLPSARLNERYILGVVLGKGGFGITYIGYDTIQRKRVAIKEFFPSAAVYRDGSKTSVLSVQPNMKQVYDNGVAKFYNEAATLSKLRDIPAIVDIYDFFYENNTAYIVMEYIDGTAVDQIVLNQGPLDLDITLTIYYPVIQALSAVHAAGLLHRDISPSNVMLDEHYRARLIDFGSSRAFSHELSTDLTVILKKGFAPIEQYTRKGRHGPAEDVYAICAAIYYTLTGKVPPAAPDRRSFDTLAPIRTFGVDISEELERVILKGMSVSAEDRYPSMDALASAIDNAVMGRAPEPPQPPKSPVLLLVIAGSLFLFLLAALLLILFL